jgi:hypothetical protein
MGCEQKAKNGNNKLAATPSIFITTAVSTTSSSDKLYSLNPWKLSQNGTIRIQAKLGIGLRPNFKGTYGCFETHLPIETQRQVQRPAVTNLQDS